ncbi:SYF2 splicing factor [Fonticula alba]|uniref:Pre-mRNA-splicing factor SYF2 n=1 Tax=Fonticula alba TaxID=691883 RepID=A0A058Z0M2_FONAL|nr:SYF2 splicing factor [Fonticula alba]KCV67819.1 SYF2 splicing factor [Fonticula alba]|eukprot:XP_009497639.1 SYF2 splicing factor [Fonticula alba]
MSDSSDDTGSSSAPAKPNPAAKLALLRSRRLEARKANSQATREEVARRAIDPRAAARAARDIQAAQESLSKQREESSRPRVVDPSTATISHINDRNALYNAALERAYGKHTKTTKENLERGTAI